MSNGKPLAHESELYHGMATWYERVFERFFGQRILDTIAQLDVPSNARVLELGVGTGLSLSAYPPGCEVIAIDLSESMLEEAHRKVQHHGWEHIELKQMDATELDFPDNHFDYVNAFHLVTVVPDHQKLLSEMIRVCKPGGTLVIINHFQSPRPWISFWVNLVDPITRPMGWRTTLGVKQFFGNAKLRIVDCYKTAWRSLFTVVIATKDSPAPEEAPAASLNSGKVRSRRRSTQLA